MALTKVPSNLDSVTATTQSASDNSTNVATTEYVTTAVANLVDGAPSTLNTLNEIAAALNDDAALNTTLTNSIATKLPLAGGTLTGAVTGTSFTAPSGFLGGSNGGIRIHAGGTKFFNITAANAAQDNIMDIGASDARFKDLHLGGIANIGSGFKLDPNSSGRIGMNRDPANGNATASSSLQRIQINGPSASGDYLDIQNYNSGGTYQGSLRISGGNAYLNGSNDMRIKLGDSGVAGISTSNNTVHIRGDNDTLKLNAAANGSILMEINGVQKFLANPTDAAGVAIGTTKLAVHRELDSNYGAIFYQNQGGIGATTHSGDNAPTMLMSAAYDNAVAEGLKFWVSSTQTEWRPCVIYGIGASTQNVLTGQTAGWVCYRCTHYNGGISAANMDSGGGGSWALNDLGGTDPIEMQLVYSGGGSNNRTTVAGWCSNYGTVTGVTRA
jgi:hypothetical protein